MIRSNLSLLYYVVFVFCTCQVRRLLFAHVRDFLQPGGRSGCTCQVASDMVKVLVGEAPEG